MSQRPCRTIEDAMRHGGCFVATCDRCRRVAIFSSSQLDRHFKARGWDTDFHSVAARIKCRRCGSRVRFGYRQGKTPQMPVALSVEVHAPAGLDPVEWYMADERERKRMVQRVRG